MNRQRWAIAALALSMMVGLIAISHFRTSRVEADEDQGRGNTRPRPGLTRGNPEEQKALSKANDAFTTAFNKGDLEGLMSLWADDSEFIHESGKVYRGKPAIRELMKQSLASNKGSKQSTRVESVRFIRPDVALEEGVVTLTDADGAANNGRYSTIWIKQDGKWLLSQVRDLPDVDDPDVPVATARLRQLAWLVGTWQNKDGTSNITLNCKWAPNQTFLLLEYTVKRGDQPASQISQRIGWDPVNEQLRSWLFDSTGGYSQGWLTREGNTWSAGTEGIYPDGQQAASQESLKFIDNDSFEWSATNRQVEEEPLPDVKITFIRKGKTR